MTFLFLFFTVFTHRFYVGWSEHRPAIGFLERKSPEAWMNVIVNSLWTNYSRFVKAQTHCVLLSNSKCTEYSYFFIKTLLHKTIPLFTQYISELCFPMNHYNQSGIQYALDIQQCSFYCIIAFCCPESLPVVKISKEFSLQMFGLRQQ